MSFSYGQNYKLQIFGESHGPAVGFVIDGLPAGVAIDMAVVEGLMERRRGGGQNATPRREADIPRFLSGIKDGRLTGAPLCAVIENGDICRADYEALATTPRPGHADYPAMVKYGGHCDLSGGGQFSGRLTAALCAAGGVCMSLLAMRGVGVAGSIVEIAGQTAPEAMREAVSAARLEGDSVGGIVECRATGLETGLGGHMFHGVENRLAAAVFAVPAVKGVEFGAGFAAARLRGSINNDSYRIEKGRIVTSTNNCGGVLGGMTTGGELVLRVALKPTPSIAAVQRTVDLASMREVEISVGGRHDPCIVPRALPAVEAAVAVALLDLVMEGGSTWE